MTDNPLRAALDILDVIDGIVDDTHPEGDGCPLCAALDDLRAALAASATDPRERFVHSRGAHRPCDGCDALAASSTDEGRPKQARIRRGRDANGIVQSWEEPAALRSREPTE